MLSRVSTKSNFNRGLDNNKKKILFILGIIFVGIVFYGLNNLSKIAPTNTDKIPLKVETGDKPIEKKINITVHTEGQPLKLRKDPDKNAEQIGLVPDKTALVATEELSGWYKVKYKDKEGWIAKEFTVLQEAPVAKEDKTKDWQTFRGTGYTVKYPKNWYVQNYSSESYVWAAFSNSELPAEPERGAVIPIELKVYDLAKKPTGGFRDDPGAKKETIKVGGVDATKFTFINTETSTETHVVEFANGQSYFSFYDNGGYLEDLNSIITTFTFA